MMQDLYKETVDFEPNFDNTLMEPKGDADTYSEFAG